MNVDKRARTQATQKKVHACTFKMVLCMHTEVVRLAVVIGQLDE